MSEVIGGIDNYLQLRLKATGLLHDSRMGIGKVRHDGGEGQSTAYVIQANFSLSTN